MLGVTRTQSSQCYLFLVAGSPVATRSVACRVIADFLFVCDIKLYFNAVLIHLQALLDEFRVCAAPIECARQVEEAILTDIDSPGTLNREICLRHTRGLMRESASAGFNHVSRDRRGSDINQESKLSVDSYTSAFYSRLIAVITAVVTACHLFSHNIYLISKSNWYACCSLKLKALL